MGWGAVQSNAWDKSLSNGLTNYLNWSATAVYLASSDEIPSPVFKKLESVAMAYEICRRGKISRSVTTKKFRGVTFPQGVETFAKVLPATFDTDTVKKGPDP